MDRKKILAQLALLLTAFIWGTSFVIMKDTLSSVTTMWMLAIRFSVAAVLLCLIAGKRLRGMSRTAVKGSVFMGVFLAAAYIFQTYGLYFSTPSKNAFLSAAYCVMTPFFAWIVYSRRAKPANVLAALLCMVGVGFVSLSQGFSDVNIGDILTIVSCVFYACQIILVEQYGMESSALCISAVQFSASAVICLAGALIFEPFPQNIGADACLSLLYLSVFCTGLCFFMQAWGMRYTPSASAAVLMSLESVFGALISVVLFHEPMTGKLIIGFVLIFVSVLISELGSSAVGEK